MQMKLNERFWALNRQSSDKERQQVLVEQHRRLHTPSRLPLALVWRFLPPFLGTSHTCGNSLRLEDADSSDKNFIF